LLLVFSGLLINNIIPTKNSPAFVATAHAATATSTITPLAPATEAQPESEQNIEGSFVTAQTVFEVAVPDPPADWAQPLETPDPQPTPLAASRQVMQ
jgi:hypothetical protein